jgi:hypothetical protein
MGHSISAFIGQYGPLRAIADALCHTHIAALPQGYSMLPVRIEVLDQCTFSLPGHLPDEYPEFMRLFPELIVVARQQASHAPLAYVETDYFGGVGTQAAVLWHGETIYGPFQSETQYEKSVVQVVPADQRAINRVLQRLGIQQEAAVDEFDALGLGQFRSNEAWIEHSESANR